MWSKFIGLTLLLMVCSGLMLWANPGFNEGGWGYVVGSFAGAGTWMNASELVDEIRFRRRLARIRAGKERIECGDQPS